MPSPNRRPAVTLGRSSCSWLTLTAITALVLAGGCRRTPDFCAFAKEHVQSSLAAAHAAKDSRGALGPLLVARATLEVARGRCGAAALQSRQIALQAAEQRFAEGASAQRGGQSVQSREIVAELHGHGEAVARFVDWAIAAGRDPAAASGSRSECGGPGEPTPGWCDARTERGYWLKYAAVQPGGFRALAAFDVPRGVRCDVLGPHELVRVWEANGGETHFEHCRIAAGPLSGLHAVTQSTERGSQLSVFNQRCLQTDKRWAAHVRGEAQAP